jgi:hypothetical protein
MDRFLVKLDKETHKKLQEQPQEASLTVSSRNMAVPIVPVVRRDACGALQVTPAARLPLSGRVTGSNPFHIAPMVDARSAKAAASAALKRAAEDTDGDGAPAATKRRYGDEDHENARLQACISWMALGVKPSLQRP